MKKLNYRLQLQKDAELGTGLGGESVNDLVPRGSDENPIIPASHIKGLMRASLREIARDRNEWRTAFDDGDQAWPDSMINKVFGAEDQQSADYEPNFRLADAQVVFADEATGAQQDLRLETRFVSRTAIQVNGIALESSLRTTESVPKDTVFEGAVFSNVDLDSVEGLAWQLSLLSVPAVGGSRNRGGQCVVEFSADGAQKSPGELLRQLDSAIKESRFNQTKVLDDSKLAAVGELSVKTTIVELLFVADSPICFPELPDKTNVITSGFSIPSTAVQGIILNHVNRRNTKLATDLFNASVFRCWPLNPCCNPAVDELPEAQSQSASTRYFDKLPYSIRISLSHRAAKFSAETRLRKFFDEAFGSRADAYDWRDKPDFAPLKAVDGVLLFGGSGMEHNPLLWRAAAMPRQITTHGVLDGPKSRANESLAERSGGRNLFSVDAMAPLIWRGMISVPENIAQPLVESLNEQAEISIGKGRTVRGLGKLMARIMPDNSQFFAGPAEQQQTVFVLQSPALIPATLYEDLVTLKKSANDILKQIAIDWLEHHGLPLLPDEKPNVWANVDIRFGWSRHNSEKGKGGPFQEAMPVLTPGSVFTLKSKADPEKLKAAVLAGFHANPKTDDPGRQRGFGAIAVHPGQAKEFYGDGSRKGRRLKTTRLKSAMEIVLRMDSLPYLPSPSQIRAVEQRIIVNADDSTNKASLGKAKEYLTNQCSHILDVWYAWEPIIDDVEHLLTDYEPVVAQKALKSLADIAVSKRKEDR